MANDDSVRFSQLLGEAAVILKGMSDADVAALLREGDFEELIAAIAAPKVPGQGTIYEYLLSSKTRLQLLARIRLAITRNYSVRGRADGMEVFVSPYFNQWVEDGVIFLQGKEAFAGLIGLYKDQQIRFAIAARDMRGGDAVGPDDLLFVDLEDARLSIRATGDRGGGFASALQDLEKMLGRRENEEASYQAFLEAHPWMLGAQHTAVHSHRALDDDNIPDFTAVRARDGARDIVEIKPPFLPLFTGDLEFRADFLRAWDQCERYLDLTRRQRQYLLEQKGLRFENPHCFLVLGYNLSDEQRSRLERKQRMNPAITILTYNDLLAMGKGVVGLLNRLQEGDGPASESPQNTQRDQVS